MLPIFASLAELEYYRKGKLAPTWDKLIEAQKAHLDTLILKQQQEKELRRVINLLYDRILERGDITEWFGPNELHLIETCR